MTASIFLCTSRGGILSFCLANILFFFLVVIKTRKNRLKRILFSVILVILLITIMVIWVGPEEWLNRFADFNRIIRAIIKEPSVLSELRPFLWKDTIKIIKDFPTLGTGLGTYCYIFPKYRTFDLAYGFLRYAHSDYLQLIAEMGIFGLFFILAFLMFFIRKYVQTVKRLT